jgi:hypothetical protein
MSGSKIPMSALAVYSGQVCLGHILPRGKSGVEAFDADDRSLGIFSDQKSAADAVSQNSCKTGSVAGRSPASNDMIGKDQS